MRPEEPGRAPAELRGKQSAEAERKSAEVLRVPAEAVNCRRDKQINYHCTDYYSLDMS